MNRPEFNRRQSDKTVYFGGLRDVNGWITKAFIGVCIWVFSQMKGEFKELKTLVTYLNAQNASTVQRVEDVFRNQGKLEIKVEDLQRLVWKR